MLGWRKKRWIWGSTCRFRESDVSECGDVEGHRQESPLDRILVETDCPYLTPVPYRGKRNEPAYVSFVAQKLAELHADTPGMSVETIGRMTTENAKRLFKIA